MTRRPALYLASASPRRRELLQQIGVDFQPLLAGEDEDVEALEAERPSEPPARYVRRVARAKLEAALLRLRRRGLAPGAVLCADTTVALGTRILGKPLDAMQARDMLGDLAGTEHRVLSAVALAWPQAAGGWRRAEALNVSRVRMSALPAQAIEDYVASGEPFGKAGAYAVQGRAAAFIQHISGSYSGVMGLPLFETAALLRQAGILS
jgi:septum formation protein